MPVEYVNRKGQTYYLHQCTTKTGKPKYVFSMKQAAHRVDTIPEGFEIYENPNAQVFLRKIQPKLIWEEEIAIVKSGMEKFSAVKFYLIDIKKNILTVFLADQDLDKRTEDLAPFSLLRKQQIYEQLTRSITYSAMLRFILIDEKERKFSVQRYCFLGSIDDWINIGESGYLKNLVKTYVKHLGKDSYYELY